MRKNIYALLAIVIFLMINDAAVAATMFGSPDCGQWVTEKRVSDKAWLLGFLSGLAGGLAGTRGQSMDPLKKLNSANQAYLWMDNYCKANPLENVTTGAYELYTELQK